MTENVNTYKGLPTFTPPGEAIDPSSLRGKSMFLIPLVPNPFNQNIQETMQGIAEKVGMTFTIYPNQGTPSEWVQGMNAALTASRHHRPEHGPGPADPAAPARAGQGGRDPRCW